MNYKKYQTNAYNLHIIKTDKFKTNMVKINFKRKVNKIDTTYRNLLTKVLLQSNKKYQTKQELEIKCEDLYNLSLSCTNGISGNYIITSINMIFLNEKYTEEKMNEESINFLLDLIFNPNVEDKKFVNFDLAKRLVFDEIKTSCDNPNTYSKRRLFEEMDDGVLSYNSIGYEDDLEKISNNDLYNYYLSMLKSDLIDIFIIGDFKDDIKNIFKNNFLVNTFKKETDKHFITHKIRKTKTVIENSPLEQAKLCLGFKLDDLTDFERKYVFYVYSFILGGGPDSKLFKNVREKNSLCYSINSSYLPVFNCLLITAGINKKDFKKCLSLIKKEINKIKKGDFTDYDIKSAIVTYISSLKDIEDSMPSILKVFESHEYLNFDLLDERINIKNVTREDIINASKKINLDTVYLLGGKDED